MPLRKVPFRYKQILSMDSYSDPTTLPDGVVRLIQNMIPDKRTLYTRNGLTRYNATALPTTGGVMANSLHVAPDDTEVELAVSGGRLFSGEGGTFTQCYDGLSTSALPTIAQFQDVSLIADGEHRLLVYKHGHDPYFAGIPSPKAYILIDACETLSGWAVVGGTASLNGGRVFQGEASIDFTSNAGTTLTATRTFTTPLNLNTYSDGSTAKNNDFISLYFLRGDPDNFDSCRIYLSSDTNFTNYFYLDLHALSEWTEELRSYIVFNFQLRRTQFSSVGSPQWNSIVAFRIIAVAKAGLSVFMTIDFIRAEKTGPIANATGVRGNLNGNYVYKVTYESDEGEESDASYASNLIYVLNGQVRLTDIPISGSQRVVRRNIYRYGGTSTSWRYVTTLEDNVQTSYVDNTGDENLGELYDEIIGEPYIPQTFTIHNNYVILANLTSTDGYNAYPNGIMVSEEGSYDVYNHLHFFEIEPESSDSIYWLVSFLGYVYVGKGKSIWRFSPDNLNLPPVVETRLYGAVGTHAVAVGENEFYFLDRTGVISYNGSFFDCISDPNPGMGRFGGVKDYILNIPTQHFDKSWLIYHDKTLYVGIPGSNDTYPTIVLCYYVPTRSWYVIEGWKMRCGHSSKSSQSGLILRLGSAEMGIVYNAFSGSTDDGTKISSVVEFPDSDYNDSDARKDFVKLFLYGSKIDTQDANLVVTPRIDLSDCTPIITIVKVLTTLDNPVYTVTNDLVVVPEELISFSQTTNQRIEIPMPQLGYYGTYLGLKLSSNQRFTLRGLSAVVRFLEDTY